MGACGKLFNTWGVYEGWWEVQVHEHRICLGLYYVIKMILETDPEKKIIARTRNRK